MKIIVFPTADFEFVRFGQLREHACGACTRCLGFGMSGLEPEEFDARKIDTTVRRARVENEIALDVVDFSANQQMLRPRDPKFDFAVLFFFVYDVEILHSRN